MSNPSSDGIPLGLVWRQVMEQLDAPQRAVVASCRPLILHESTFMVSAPNEFTRDRLENRLRSRIEHTLSDHYARSVHLVVSIDPSLACMGRSSSTASTRERQDASSASQAVGRAGAAR